MSLSLASQRLHRLARVLLASVIAVAAAWVAADETPPRKPVAYRLVVKFRDEVRMRLDADGRFVSSAADVQALEQLRVGGALQARQLIGLSEAELAELEFRAAKRSGRRQPDLAGIFALEAPNLTPSVMAGLAERLRSLPEVDYAYVSELGLPPPADIIPQPTPSFVANQKYLPPNPGMDVHYAWSLGARGAGVRLSDVEYGWDYGHEDLMGRNLHPEPGQTIDPNVPAEDRDHGTQVLGITSAEDDSYGCTGIAPDAEVYTFPAWTVQRGVSTETALAKAVDASSPGDVVLIELHGTGLGPAEVDLAVFNAVKVGIAAGVVIVEAAGNAGWNLDDPNSVPVDVRDLFSEYLARGDSGAILVGAGTADSSHDALTVTTNFGKNVDVQGWGQGALTLGDGAYANFGLHQEYVESCCTSAAAAQVAGAAAVIQSRAAALGLPALDGPEMRDLLVKTGWPQGRGGHIGPFPNLRSALDDLASRTSAGIPAWALWLVALAAFPWLLVLWRSRIFRSAR